MQCQTSTSTKTTNHDNICQQMVSQLNPSLKSHKQYQISTKYFIYLHLSKIILHPIVIFHVNISTSLKQLLKKIPCENIQMRKFGIKSKLKLQYLGHSLFQVIFLRLVHFNFLLTSFNLNLPLPQQRFQLVRLCFSILCYFTQFLTVWEKRVSNQ